MFQKLVKYLGFCLHSVNNAHGAMRFYCYRSTLVSTTGQQKKETFVLVMLNSFNT